MKYLPLALLTFAAVGCGHNEFDVSAAQVSRHKSAHSSTGADQVHLPPGGMKFKKGDRMPDGTIADHAGNISSDGR